MTKFDIDDRDLWFRCEIAVGLWLEDRHGEANVSWANERPSPPVRPADRVSKRDGAPRVKVGSRQVRSPDFRVDLGGGHEIYWEVKQRSAAWRDESEGTSYFWLKQEVFSDYLDLANEDPVNRTVQLIVYEGNYLSGRWLRADVRELQRASRTRRFQFENESGVTEAVDAVLWPVHSMLELSLADRPELVDAARFVGKVDEINSATPIKATPRLGQPGDIDAQLELERLRKEIGLKSFPRYSILYAHSANDSSVDLGKILSLTDYGLRVFLITTDQHWHSRYLREPERCEALMGSSILEVSIVSSIPPQLRGVLQIDGIPSGDAKSPDFQELWGEAETAGRINTRQYEIVHAGMSGDVDNTDAPVVVTASAGSGKTETLTERILFLLCTSSIAHTAPTVEQSPAYDLGLDEIVLITFTREAAREMRQRITRSLVLRRRLCVRCAMPVLAWLSQLGSTNISTIHTFAKRLIQDLGPRQGVATDFTVGTDYERLQEIMREVVGDFYLELSDDQRKQFPEMHKAHTFVKEVWDSLIRHGTNVLNLQGGTSQVAILNWAPENCGNEWARVLGGRLPEIIDRIASAFRVVCRERKLVPTDQLLSVAADLVRPRDGEEDDLTVPRYLFIDEFQDTDEQQIDLALNLWQRGTKLFVVGDSKQAIYRFRGAAGNAFELLRYKLRSSLVEYSLVRNFRTDGRLLEEMQAKFDSWAELGHLDGQSNAKLEPSHELAGTGIGIKLLPLEASYRNRRESALRLMAEEVQDWLAQPWAQGGGGESKIAVLCRTNRQAQQVKEFLGNSNYKINCEVAKGGDFFRSRAVAELRVLLRALANPGDLGTLLELLETAWGAAIYRYQETHGSGDGRGLRRYIDDAEISRHWTEPLASGGVQGWGKRLALSKLNQIDRSDLTELESRMRSLSRLLQRLPLLELISEIDLVFEPQNWLAALGDDQPSAYERNLDHVLVLLDDAFGEASVSVWDAIKWLNLKANTDRDEEEPDSVSVSDVLAITVHKAKGREFDAVVIPFCDASFTSEYRTSVSLVSNHGGRRVGWRWWDGFGKSGRLIDKNFDGSFEAHDHLEAVREETRLLYVAMTRAKKRLTIVAHAGSGQSNPECWADLLS